MISKKILTLLLAVLMLAGSFVSCGDAAPADNVPQNADSPAAEETEAAAE